MGAHGLAIAVWLGSIALYGAAFFFPEVHRRHDFFWSGVSAFYGLVLWFTAAQTSPTELLGHLASVVLLGWLGWQTLTLRRKRTPLDLQTPVTQNSWSTLGQRLRQAALELLQGTPLGRWLPRADNEMLPGDPAIATSEIRASSLKDVDYEFVDEVDVAPSPRRSPSPRAVSAETLGPIPESIVVEPAKPPASPSVKTARLPQPRIPQTAPAAKKPQDLPKNSPKTSPAKPKQQSPRVGDRLVGLKAWMGDIVKAKTSPKPKRAVIEIPPRPSPLAKNRPQPAANPGSVAGRSSGLGQSATVTIVDTEATESFDGPEGGDSPRDPRSEAVPVSGGPQSANFGDRDSQTILESQSNTVEATIPDSEVPQSPSLTDAEEEENWPDDL